jgi:hypothetical protein
MSSERTPLLDHDNAVGYNYGRPVLVEDVVKKPTPLPKLQLFSILYIQFCEPLTATVIYPFIVNLVQDTGITSGDEAKTGYYAGVIVSDSFLINTEIGMNTSTGIRIFRCRSLDGVAVGPYVRSDWTKATIGIWDFGTGGGYYLLWPLEIFLVIGSQPLRARDVQWKYWNLQGCHGRDD